MSINKNGHRTMPQGSDSDINESMAPYPIMAFRRIADSKE